MKRMMLWLTLIGFLTACTPTWRPIHVSGELPGIVFNFERMRVADFSIQKLVLQDSEALPVDYWYVYAPDREAERWLDRIRYGQVPSGYDESAPAKSLSYGLYRVHASASAEQVGDGEFAVVRRFDDKPVTINLELNMPYEAVISCLQKYDYERAGVWSNCPGIAKEP